MKKVKKIPNIIIRDLHDHHQSMAALSAIIRLHFSEYRIQYIASVLATPPEGIHQFSTDVWEFVHFHS